MTLDEFRTHLKEIDARMGADTPMADYKAKQEDANRFTFYFDGLIHCDVAIESDNTITEICEFEWRSQYASIEAYKDHLVGQFA